MKTALVKMQNGKPLVKFPGSSHFLPLTDWFALKSLKQVVVMLRKLPANDNTDFLIVESN